MCAYNSKHKEAITKTVFTKKSTKKGESVPLLHCFLLVLQKAMFRHKLAIQSAQYSASN